MGRTCKGHTFSDLVAIHPCVCPAGEIILITLQGYAQDAAAFLYQLRMLPCHVRSCRGPVCCAACPNRDGLLQYACGNMHA
jgi:hypothetical protein